MIDTAAHPVTVADNVVALHHHHRPGGIPEVSNLPHRVNLALYQGVSFALKVTITHDGEPDSLTGVMCEAQIRARPPDQQVMAAFQVTVENNAIFLALDSDQTAGLSAQGGVWDIRLTGADYTAVILRGHVRVMQRVTR